MMSILNKKTFKTGLLCVVVFNLVFISGLLMKYNNVPVTRFATDGWYKAGKLLRPSGNSGAAAATDGQLLLVSYNDEPRTYELPDLPYDKLSASQKILHKLNEVATDKETYWVAHSELADYEIQIDPQEFTRDACRDKARIFYDPRFTLTVVLDEVRRQYLAKNRANDKLKVEQIRIPFAWQDWVDLTMLNPYIADQLRGNCKMLKDLFNEGTKDPGYCLDVDEVNDRELQQMALPLKKFLPGFSVRRSPGTLATNEVRMLELKLHLLTYGINPVSIMFLTDLGVYEAYVDRKQRLVDLELFENYLQLKQLDLHLNRLVTMNPVREFAQMVEQVPGDVDSAEDPFGMVKAMNLPNSLELRAIDVPRSAFNYQQEHIDRQIKELEEQGKRAKSGDAPPLTVHERLFLDGMKRVNQFEVKDEITYFKMARLRRTPDNPRDDGWHYEWRFFNGALRYVKEGWTEEEVVVREKIVLDRILRNWYKFAKERGILLWVAHGPLLAWYWDGLLFPYDEDIDIQLPATELVRFAKHYNQTLVVENVLEGFGKFFIDCLTFLHHRGKTHKDNHIDARFIDVDSGSYIDITGLGVSKEPLPEKFKDHREWLEKHPEETRLVYNCRNVHFYSQEEISPLLLTSMAHTPLYIPNGIQPTLKDEYSRGMTWYEYYNFYYVDKLNLWLHIDQMKNILPAGLDYKNNNDCIREIQALNDEHILQLLKENRLILIEYYLTREMTQKHRQELAFLFENERGEDTNILQLGKQRPIKQVLQTKEYHELTAHFRFGKPVSRPLFNYEMIDRKKHRKEE